MTFNEPSDVGLLQTFHKVAGLQFLWFFTASKNVKFKTREIKYQ